MKKSFSEIRYRNLNWGYWFGGGFCLIGLLALALGISPLLVSARSRPAILQIPGEGVADLKLPGAYLAICISRGVSSETVNRLFDLEYTLTEQNKTDLLPIVKLPPRKYVSEAENNQVPLFQFVIDEPGRYVLRAESPYSLDLPKVSIVLYHIDVRYVRTQLGVGILVFLVFLVLGIYFIRKTAKVHSQI